jgi:outer membrane protein assembly factor BamB
MKKWIIAGMLAGSIGLSSLAQKTTPEWTVDVGGMIAQANFMEQTDAGMLVVCTPTKIIGINPRTKAMAWETKEIRNVQQEEYKPINGTQYFMVEFQKETSLKKNKTVAIFDSYSGKMVYNSRDEDIKVRNTRIMPQMKGLLIEAEKDGKYFIAFLDFAQSQVTWSKELGEVKKGGFGIGALVRAVKSQIETIFKVAPVVDDNGNLVLASKDRVFCINGKTGATLWEKEFKDNITDFIFTTDKKGLFVVYDDRLDRVEVASGKLAYDKPLKLDGKVNGILPYNNEYILMHSDGFNILNDAGEFRWKKDASVGNVGYVWPIADGFITVELAEDKGKIFKVTAEGKKKWDESLSDAIYKVEPIANGVIYITTKKANILNYEKGKDVWAKDIKIKGNPAFGVDEAKHVVYVFSNKTLSAFNLADGTYKVIAEDLKLKDYDDDKEMAKVEVRAEGIFISTNQNAALVKEDGNVVYNKHFTEAGLSKGARRLLGTLGAVASVAGTATAVAGLAKPQDWKVRDTYYDPKTNTQVIEVTSRQMETGAAVAGGGDALYAFSQNRYFATQSAKNTVYILSRWEEGTGLVVIDKGTGNEIKRIVFNDKTPQYVVDETDYKVYVIVSGKELRAYDLKK